MIANERQLQAAQVQLERFETALNADVSPAQDPAIEAAQRRAVRNQVAELRGEIDRYLSLREGRVRSIPIRSLRDIPDALIASRVAAGLTQRELAGRLGLKEQQIQRYESQRYRGVSIDRIVEIADAIGADLPGELVVARRNSAEAVLKRLQLFGLEQSFVERRLAPSGSMDELALTARLQFVFGWDDATLAGSGPLPSPLLAGATARFKMPRGRVASRAAAYTAYAYRLAEICAATRDSGARGQIPIRAGEMRAWMLDKYGAVDLAAVLDAAWDLGIIVIPLSDAGSFHGACWRINGVNVVVLKQGDRSPSKWVIDLLHEIFHAGRHPELDTFEVVEDEETSEVRRTDDEEVRATWFASQVVLGEHVEEMFRSAVAKARGNLRMLKSAILETATASNVDVGALANYAAFRLSMQNDAWWGAAANLQDRSIDALAVTRDRFFSKFDFSSLNEDELELLTLALNDEGDDHG